MTSHVDGARVEERSGRACPPRRSALAVCAALLVSSAGAAQDAPDPPVPAAPAAPAEAYVARFLHALEALDAGRNDEAARVFRHAGELAPDAPVWRVGAGVADARAGKPEAAGAEFDAALARGYPASDLAALAAGLELALPNPAAVAPDPTWIHATIQGLAGIRGDTVGGRFFPVPSEPDLPTHLVGRYTAGSLGMDEGRHVVDAFVVDPATGRIAPANYPGTGRFRTEPLVPKHRMPFKNDHEPWPRAIPLVRAFRSGLLADGLEWMADTVPRGAAVRTEAHRHTVTVLGAYFPEYPTQRSAEWAVPRARPLPDAGDDAPPFRVGDLPSDGNRERHALLELDGRVRFDPRRVGLGQGRLVCDERGELVVAEGADALFLFRGHELARAAAPEPFVTLWWYGDTLAAVAQDGTWSLPRRAVASARVVLGDVLAPALPLAPWLLDPLHVRTMALDADPAPRRFPRP